MKLRIVEKKKQTVTLTMINVDIELCSRGILVH